MTPSVRVTKHIFEKFRQHCYRWQHKLLLGRWDLHVEWCKVPHQADADCQYDGMLATIRLTRSSIQFDPERLAFHEVGEIYLWRMREVMEEAGVPADEVDRIIHESLNSFENAIFGKGEK